VRKREAFPFLLSSFFFFSFFFFEFLISPRLICGSPPPLSRSRVVVQRNFPALDYSPPPPPSYFPSKLKIARARVAKRRFAVGKVKATSK